MLVTLCCGDMLIFIQAGILLESGAAAAGTPVQYVDVQYATAPPTPASISQEVAGSGGSAAYVQTAAAAVQRAAAVHAASQSYGVKRVLAVPRQVICTPPTSYSAVYGAAGAVMPPPVKIVAGLGGQRMVTRTVSPNEIQIVPKTQN